MWGSPLAKTSTMAGKWARSTIEKHLGGGKRWKENIADLQKTYNTLAQLGPPTRKDCFLERNSSISHPSQMAWRKKSVFFFVEALEEDSNMREKHREYTHRHLIKIQTCKKLSWICTWTQGALALAGRENCGWELTLPLKQTAWKEIGGVLFSVLLELI